MFKRKRIVSLAIGSLLFVVGGFTIAAISLQDLKDQPATLSQRKQDTLDKLESNVQQDNQPQQLDQPQPFDAPQQLVQPNIQIENPQPVDFASIQLQQGEKSGVRFQLREAINGYYNLNNEATSVQDKDLLYKEIVEVVRDLYIRNSIICSERSWYEGEPEKIEEYHLTPEDIGYLTFDYFRYYKGIFLGGSRYFTRATTKDKNEFKEVLGEPIGSFKVTNEARYESDKDYHHLFLCWNIEQDSEN